MQAKCNFKLPDDEDLSFFLDEINKQESNDDMYMPILCKSLIYLGKCHLIYDDESEDTNEISEDEIILKIKDIYNILTSGNQNIIDFIISKDLVLYIFDFFLNPINFTESFQLIDCIQAFLRIPIYKSEPFLFHLWVDNFMEYSPEQFQDIEECDFIEKVITTFRSFDIPNCLQGDFSIFEEPTFLTHLCEFRYIDQCYNSIILFFDYLHTFLPSDEETLLQTTVDLIIRAPYSAYYDCSTLLLHLSIENPAIFADDMIFEMIFKLFATKQYPIVSNLFLLITNLQPDASIRYITKEVIKTLSETIISFSSKTAEDEETKISESLELSSVKLLNHILSNDDGNFFDLLFINASGFNLLPYLLECMDHSLFEMKAYLSETLFHIMNILLINNEQFQALYTSDLFIERISQYLILAFDTDDETMKNSIIHSLFSTLTKLHTLGCEQSFINFLQSENFIDVISEDPDLDEDKVSTLIHGFFEN